MLTITIEGDELFNDETQTFLYLEGVVVHLEHSLLSMSKWESKYEKPFLSPGEKTSEEVYGYIKAMIMDEGLDPDVIRRLSSKNIEEIQLYIDSKQSATTFGQLPTGRGSGETITSELIYYWMVAFTIPFEAEDWHLNRLLSLIRICNIKNSKPKKMSRHDIAQRNRDLNEQRKREFNTTG